MLHPFNIHYWSCDVGHRHPFPTITNLKSPPGKSFILSMNVLPDQTITCKPCAKHIHSDWLTDKARQCMIGPGSKNILIASNPLPGQPWFPPPWVQAACPPRAPQQHLQGAPPSSGARPGRPARPSSWRWGLPFVQYPGTTESGGRLSIQVERGALWEVGTHEECDFSFKRLLNIVEWS